MNFIDRLERRFGAYAIPGLIRIVVLLNALVFIMSQANPALIGVLDLTREGLARHEYWRLFTYIFIPNANSIFIIFALLFLWSIGERLEQEWGAFRLNLFYFLGMFGTTVAAVFFGTEYSNWMLNLSLLFAYAYFNPNGMLLFPPIPIKWLAFILGGITVYEFLVGPWSHKAAILASLINYIVFFGPGFMAEARQRQRVAGRRRQFEENSIPQDEPLHRCIVCKRTEKDSPDLEFRYSSRDGEEYCHEHLPKAP